MYWGAVMAWYIKLDRNLKHTQLLKQNMNFKFSLYLRWIQRAEQCVGKGLHKLYTTFLVHMYWVLYSIIYTILVRPARPLSSYDQPQSTNPPARNSFQTTGPGQQTLSLPSVDVPALQPKTLVISKSTPGPCPSTYRRYGLCKTRSHNWIGVRSGAKPTLAVTTHFGRVEDPCIIHNYWLRTASIKQGEGRDFAGFVLMVVWRMLWGRSCHLASYSYRPVDGRVELVEQLG